jgi:shikimate kinase/3-dehydroquinate synthase
MRVFLVGFMAAGKTTVGRLLAAQLGVPFVDVDDVVTEFAGARPAELLARRGEPAFRQIEATAVESVLTGPPAVVATGGGAACQPGAMARLLSAGLVVALDVPLADALARAGSPDERPLLARSPDQVAALYAARRPIYRQAHAVVPVAGQPADEVALRARVAVDRARALGELLPGSVLVSLADRTYSVAIGAGALARLGELARGALGADVSRLALVSDSNVAPLHGCAALSALAAAGFDVVATTVPAGEPAKSLDSFGALQELLVGAGLDRSSAIVALGGGVVGDLAGFVAATLYRGMPCIQVPTTLLAMVDSAIGGKTGINLEAGKNLVGAFHQPRLVLCDPALLATLPARERRAAYGELVKYGLLDGEELYGEVDRLAVELGADSWSEPGSLVTVIRRSVAVKAAIVAADEREAVRGPGGDRALLNLGHTVGHAIEVAAGYGALLHGEAVALGLVAASRISAALGLCDPALERRVSATLARAGLDTNLDRWLRPDVLDRIGVDKKRTGTRIRLVALEGPGRARLVPLELVRLREILAAPGRL